MKRQDKFLCEIKNIDINTDLVTTEQLNSLTDTIISEIKLPNLESKVHEVTMNLAQVGPAKFGASVTPLLMEDETRLNLIYMLNYNFDNFKASYNYIKRHRENADTEQLLGLVYKLKELVDIVFNYGTFTLQQKEEQEKYLAQLNETNKNLLDRGDLYDKG